MKINSEGRSLAQQIQEDKIFLNKIDKYLRNWRVQPPGKFWWYLKRRLFKKTTLKSIRDFQDLKNRIDFNK